MLKRGDVYQSRIRKTDRLVTILSCPNGKVKYHQHTWNDGKLIGSIVRTYRSARLLELELNFTSMLVITGGKANGSI